MNVQWGNDVRQTEIDTAEPLVPEPTAFEVEVATKTHTNHQILIIPQQNGLRQEVEQFALNSTNVLILFGKKRICLNGRNRSPYLFIRRVMKQIVINIEAYHFCQLNIKFYPTSCYQGQQHIKRKLLCFINVDFDATGQILIVYAFVKYVIQRSSASAIDRLKESL